MPIAASSTSVPRRRPRGRTQLEHLLRNEWCAIVDVGHLLRFRATTISRRRRAVGLLAFAAVTVLAAVVPAYVPGAGTSERSVDVLVLLPSAFAAFQLLVLASAVASGGGRELVPREQLVAYPVSPTTDHLGALLLAPLNIAWLIQSWALLGATAYGVGPDRYLPAVLGSALWILAATAVGQVVAWSIEGVRRLPHGIATVRLAGVAVLAGAGVLQVTGRLGPLLDRVPTRWFVVGLVEGTTWRWAATLLVMMVMLLAAVVVGAVPAHYAARLQPRDELRSESGRQRPLPEARTILGAMIRTDRSSVWRAVPMRRGLLVLAIGPGLVSLAGDLPWSQLTILPGLVASGGALLFGVNAWCLDTRGVLWRESLPVGPGAVFAARAWVLTEFLLVASGITLALACLRAGVPTAAELVALLCVWLVVLAQVVTASLRWAQRSPYAADLRSARATPAPPVAMVVYSTKLAVATTLTSLVFSGLARAPHWSLSVLVALPFLAWSAVRLLQARDGWVDPVERVRIVTTVAG